jgi:hypothetical protein
MTPLGFNRLRQHFNSKYYLVQFCICIFSHHPPLSTQMQCQVVTYPLITNLDIMLLLHIILVGKEYLGTIGWNAIWLQPMPILHGWIIVSFCCKLLYPTSCIHHEQACLPSTFPLVSLPWFWFCQSRGLVYCWTWRRTQQIFSWTWWHSRGRFREVQNLFYESCKGLVSNWMQVCELCAAQEVGC